MRGTRHRWVRPVVAGVVAFLLLLLALYALDRAGTHIDSADVLGAALVAFLVGAMLG